MSKYDVAQICLNGHLINYAYNGSPHRNHSFCPQCGKETITNCPACSDNIRGGVIVRRTGQVMPMREVPFYCGSCGVPYPWRQLTIDAAKELIQELEGVEQDEKDKVAAGIEDIIGETPKTKLAATRMQKILNQAKEASSPIVQALRAWSVDFASETAKKIITGL